jgi:hypothetical protein
MDREPQDFTVSEVYWEEECPARLVLLCVELGVLGRNPLLKPLAHPPLETAR